MRLAKAPRAAGSVSWLTDHELHQHLSADTSQQAAPVVTTLCVCSDSWVTHSSHKSLSIQVSMEVGLDADIFSMFQLTL